MTGPEQTPAAATATRAQFLAFLTTDKAKAAIAPMLPKEQTHERIVREVMNATADNPDIMGCTPESIIQAISRAVSWDLEIGVGAFLVPRKDKRGDAHPKLRAQIGYRGKIELMLRYRAARFIDYHCIYSNEHYRCEYGTNPFIEHRPILDPTKRGTLLGGYAYAQMTQVHSIIVEMSRAEVDQIRQDYSAQWKTKWVNGQKVALPLDEISWYVEARCVHRLAKRVPMRGVLGALIAEGGEVEEGVLDEEIEVVSTVRREIGVGSAEPMRTQAGPGLATVESAPIAGENDHAEVF